MKLKFMSVMLVLFLTATIFAGGKKEEVIIDNTPKRIVSLSPAATEILFAVGAGNNVVARTDFCNYPEEVSNIPSMGGFDGKAFSLESVIAYEPDLVIATAGMHDHLLVPLEAFGATVYMSSAQTFEKLYTEISDIANLTGNADTGASIVTEMKATIDSIASKIANKDAKSVYWEVWHEPFMSVGAASYIHEIIAKAGGKNIFSNVEQGYPVVSEESILASNPQAIALPRDSVVTKEMISARTGWDNIDAVKNGAIYFLPGDIVSRPGPRSAQAVKLLAQELYPDENL